MRASMSSIAAQCTRAAASWYRPCLRCCGAAFHCRSTDRLLRGAPREWGGAWCVGGGEGVRGGGSVAFADVAARWDGLAGRRGGCRSRSLGWMGPVGPHRGRGPRQRAGLLGLRTGGQSPPRGREEGTGLGRARGRRARGRHEATAFGWFAKCGGGGGEQHLGRSGESPTGGNRCRSELEARREVTLVLDQEPVDERRCGGSGA